MIDPDRERFILVCVGGPHPPAAELRNVTGMSRHPLANLEQIAAYVEEQSPRSALSLVRELRSAASDWRCPTRLPWSRAMSIRTICRRPFGRCLIFYRASRALIEVIHILHGARSYEALLFPEQQAWPSAFGC